MRAHNIFVIVAGLLVAVAATGQVPHSLVNLGSVDGKNYFYDKTDRTWAASRDFCIESGMQLATVETASQAEFLKSKYNSSTFDWFFWTAGRDAHLPRQYTWEGTDFIQPIP